jgi:response regulator RpfG family c-di-GMP phosphodiesterase
VILERVLFVDDDPNLLEASRRVMRGTYDVVTALGGEDGMKAVKEKGPFAVVVSDLRMPVIDGITLLRHVHETAPETVRILLTGNADTTTAIQSVNEGQIFRFLTKPCPGSVIRDALRDGVRQYRLQTSERVLTEHTLRGSIRALVEMLSLVHPAISARTSRVRRLTLELCEKLNAPDSWRIEIAALLSHVGYIGMPPALVDRILAGQPLSEDEAHRAAKAPEVSAKLIASIPRMEEVQNILLMQGTHWDGTNATVQGMHKERIPLGARILRVAIDFDSLGLQGAGSEQALETITGAEGVYDPGVVEALNQLRGCRVPEPDTIAVKLSDLMPGMVFSKDLRTSAGLLVVAKGQDVTEQVLTHVRQHWDAKAADTVVHVHFADIDDTSAAA